MRTNARWLRSTRLALVLAVNASASPALAGEVIIHASALRPPVLSAVVGERVTFVNQSGRPVHVEFGVDPDRHHVFQVPDRIWAIFHRSGRHPYAVHVIEGGDIRELRGIVAIAEGVRDPSLPECPGFATVMGSCLAP